VYPHDDPRGWVDQQYRPDELAGVTLYEPTTHGFEQEVTIRMKRNPPTQPTINEQRP
jgi:putative ATPase